MLPLVLPYMGPYKVSEMRPKFFMLHAGIRTEAVSVDNLKGTFSQKLRHRLLYIIRKLFL